MKTVGLWGRSEAFLVRLRSMLEQAMQEPVRLVSLPSAADLMAVSRFALLAVAPTTDAALAATLPPCHLLLLPSCERLLLQNCAAGCVIDYGGSSKDSFTLSSIEQGRLCLAIQREIVRLDGGVIEPQELPLRIAPGQTALDLLFHAALLLVLGFPAEELEGLCRALEG